MKKPIEIPHVHTLLHQYSEWLDPQYVQAPIDGDDRTHDELVSSFLATRDRKAKPDLAGMEMGADAWQYVHKLKMQLAAANKNMGKQGDTIHMLRAELAEVRTLNSKVERGELRRLQRREQILSEDLARAIQEITELRVKLEENPIGMPRLVTD